MLATITADDNSSRVSIWQPLIKHYPWCIYGEIAEIYTLCRRASRERGKTVAGPHRKSGGWICIIAPCVSSYIHFNVLDIMYSIVVHNAIDRWNIYRALATYRMYGTWRTRTRYSTIVEHEYRESSRTMLLLIFRGLCAREKIVCA